MSNQILKATHSTTDKTPLKIGEVEIPCYVLSDGTRVLSRIGFLRALGRTGKAKGGRKYDQESQIPVFLTANNLKPFITNELLENLKPVIFLDLNGNESIGYKAELLPDILWVFSDAYDKGILKSTQIHIGVQAKILLKAFTKTTIIALVDEATGYQHVREKDELQKILRAYISQELLPWQQRFPDIFYKELFRLNGWDYTVKGIKKRPGVIGTWTNRLIYEQLPPGVLKELKSKTPKSDAGHYTARFFQSLTPDTGDPHLTAQIQQITTLFQLSDNMKHMWQQFEKLKLRQSGQLELPFQFDEKGHTIEPPIQEDNLSAFNKSLKIALEYNPKSK